MSKKICILGANNLKHMTLISLYTDIFEEYNQSYDIIYLDRYHKEENSDAENVYRYELNLKTEWPLPVKLAKYWGFRKYAVDIIEQNNYDFVIAWNEFTAFMFSDYLAKKYKGRYSINIRDYNYNNVFIVQNRLRKAVENARFSTISSARFLNFLPKGNYLFIHSYNHKILSGLPSKTTKKTKEAVINIMFIGRMSYPDTIKKTIDTLGNDKRFQLYLIGAGCDSFSDYVKENGYKNVLIHDSFEASETASFLDKADIIYSLNKENEIFSDVLLPIKLYYAIHMHVPVLAFKSSYTYEYAHSHNFGIGITMSTFENIGDIVYDTYHSIPYRDLEIGCNEAMEEILQGHMDFRRNVVDVLEK